MSCIKNAAHAVVRLVMATALIGVSAAAAQQSYSATVVDKCRPEALRICPDHVLGSPEMRYCMETKARMISRDCLMALEDDGIIPRGSSKQARAR